MAAAAAGGRGRSGSSGPQTLNLLRPGSGSGGTTNLLQSTGAHRGLPGRGEQGMEGQGLSWGKLHS